MATSCEEPAAEPEPRHGRAIGVGTVAGTLAVFLLVALTSGLARLPALDLAIVLGVALSLLAILAIVLRRP